ncbi:DUF4328 domain-containing protein, partial [Streptomyces boluensis]
PSPAAASDGPTEPGVRSPRVLGLLLLVAVVASGVAAVAAALAQWHMKSLIRPLSQEATARTAEGYQRAEMWLGNTGGVLRGCLALTVLLLVAWFFQMRANALVLDPSWPQRQGMGWLLLSCLCAIGLFFVPKMIVNDVWAASTPPPGQRRGNALLTVWWLAVLGTSFQLWNGFAVLADGDDAVWAVTDGVTDLLIGDAFAVAACALTFVVVRRLGALQDRHPAAPVAG